MTAKTLYSTWYGGDNSKFHYWTRCYYILFECVCVLKWIGLFSFKAEIDMNGHTTSAKSWKDDNVFKWLEWGAIGQQLQSTFGANRSVNPTIYWLFFKLQCHYENNRLVKFIQTYIELLPKTSKFYNKFIYLVR